LHCVEKYGKAQVETWSWELWNEPDIAYWKGTPEEYDKLYDYTADAVRRALPNAKVGGPATTGPARKAAGDYLRQFLEHCANGKNFVTGRTGTPLDFITFHAKGQPKVVDGHVQMGLLNNLRDVDEGLAIVASFPKFASLPIVLSESDPEGCAACSVATHPQNAYRNGTMYPSYTAAAVRNILDLNQKHKTNIVGILTWAFEFEDQPYFAGFRDLATNGIDKPVLNLFRMLGMMGNQRIASVSSGAVDVSRILDAGVRDKADIDAIATRTPRRVTVLLWNYHDDDVTAPDTPVKLDISGLPEESQKMMMRHYRIDHDHSNAYTVWQELGSPQSPTPEQYAKLKASGELQLLGSPFWAENKMGTVTLEFNLPRQAVSLVELVW
jgi:xylan 1,4-beta-xylosidase